MLPMHMPGGKRNTGSLASNDITDLPSDIFPEHVTTMPIREASGLLSRKISSKDAEGLISADYIYSYPPGIPVILPGDRITEQQISLAGGTLSVLS